MTIETVLPALVEHLGKKLVDRLFAVPDAKKTVLKDRIAEALATHTRLILNWSASVQFFRMPSARSVEDETIPLHFAGAPRRFRSSSHSAELLCEIDILSQGFNFIILGPPGAGKTTTLKRLARTTLLSEPVGPLDTFQTPLLVQLRKFNNSEDVKHALLLEIAHELGLEIHTPEFRQTRNVQLNDGRTEARESVVRGDPLCEGQPIDKVIPRVLSELRPILLIDGLDEASHAVRESVELDIELLLERQESYRVIVTCRSADYQRPISYLNAIEVCELEDEEIASLAAMWLGDRSSEFMTKIATPSLGELARRPLFLTHMLTLYDLDGTLPQQPFEVYELMVMLMIREWDRERRIQRRSRYADFTSEKKLRFLSAVAFQLTFIHRIKYFSEQDLISVYKKLCRDFGLPPDEAVLVAREIETHTGIITEVGPRHYEFAHLTVQEYLCATHLVRSPFPQRKIAQLLAHYPAPLAIATAISAEPAAWLAAVLTSETVVSGPARTRLEAGVISFLDRLRLENPVLTDGDALGLCVLSLCDAAYRADRYRREQIGHHLSRLLASVPARRSFVQIITLQYRTQQDIADSGCYLARRAVGDDSSFEPDDAFYLLEYPEEARISMAWIQENFASELMFGGYTLAKRR